MKFCSVSGCGKPHIARGWCHTHYKRWQTNGDPLLGAKVVWPPICSVKGCGKPSGTRGLCETHYTRWRRHGDPSVLRIAPNGSGYVTASGYRRVHDNGDQKSEHVVMAERALGHRLPDDAEVHHANRKRSDNSNGNLVICPNAAYHALLHVRTAALDACGHAGWRRCCHCKQYDDSTNMIVQKGYCYHALCRKQYQVALKERKTADRHTC